MNFETPYLFYIVGAYGITIVTLGIFMVVIFYQWNKSKRLVDET